MLRYLAKIYLSEKRLRKSKSTQTSQNEKKMILKKQREVFPIMHLPRTIATIRIIKTNNLKAIKLLM